MSAAEEARAPAFAAPTHPGLTKLEYFAGQAMQGLLAQGRPVSDPLLPAAAIQLAYNLIAVLELSKC